MIENRFRSPTYIGNIKLSQSSNDPAQLLVNDKPIGVSSEDLEDYVLKTTTINGHQLDANIIVLDADSIPDSSTDNKFVTENEKNTWNGKQNALSNDQLAAVNSGIDSTKVAKITTNENNITTINNKIPVGASSENKLVDTATMETYALPLTTKYGASIVMSIDSSTYVVTVTLKDQDGNTLGTAQTIDLPLESVVVSGSYNDVTKKVILTLQNGSTVEFSIADLIDGLVPNSRTIAGLDLSQNRTAQELTDNLIYCNSTTDIDYIMGDS